MEYRSGAAGRIRGGGAAVSPALAWLMRLSFIPLDQRVAGLSFRETWGLPDAARRRCFLAFARRILTEMSTPRFQEGRLSFGICFYSLRTWLINVLTSILVKSWKTLVFICLGLFYPVGFASCGRCSREFSNNRRVGICEFWNARRKSASFRILPLIRRPGWPFNSVPSGFCFILFGYDVLMS